MKQRRWTKNSGSVPTPVCIEVTGVLLDSARFISVSSTGPSDIRIIRSQWFSRPGSNEENILAHGSTSHCSDPECAAWALVSITPAEQASEAHGPSWDLPFSLSLWRPPGTLLHFSSTCIRRLSLAISTLRTLLPTYPFPFNHAHIQPDSWAILCSTPPVGESTTMIVLPDDDNTAPTAYGGPLKPKAQEAAQEATQSAAPETTTASSPSELSQPPPPYAATPTPLPAPRSPNVLNVANSWTATPGSQSSLLPQHYVPAGPPLHLTPRPPPPPGLRRRTLARVLKAYVVAWLIVVLWGCFLGSSLDVHLHFTEYLDPSFVLVRHLSHILFWDGAQANFRDTGLM